MDIRNFSIIAHIDHGKSTLADRLLQLTGAISDREMKQQALDSMDIERERGITIKAQTARLNYTAKDGKKYVLNLIDTPGHVDFTYEVSRSLAACEGAILVVDATQGIEAQTLANVNLALENDLIMIPVINKVDLPAADVESVSRQIEEVIGLPAEEIIAVSAKSGLNMEAVLEAIVERIPPPERKLNTPPRALLLDSWYDTYQGVVILARVMEGELKTGDLIKFMATGAQYEIDKLGVFTPKAVPVKSLQAGEVGFISAAIRTVSDAKVGDTITLAKGGASEPLPGFNEAKPMVFSGLYPVDSDDYERLRDALGKLRLNDSSFHFLPETSMALGFGFRCGFLGLLHMGIIRERLEREFNLELISTAPSVAYRVTMNDGEVLIVDNPAKLPEPNLRRSIEEPYMELTIICPDEFIGAVMSIVRERRGEQKSMEFISPKRVKFVFLTPLNEVVMDFFDKLKSLTRGYASMDYEYHGYRAAQLVKLDLLVNGEPLDTLSCIVHRDKAHQFGRELTDKMRKLIPRQMFDVAVQAAIGGKIVSRADVKAMRKNVLAKCYGGDITRKRKLLEKQKEGKKRMKSVGRVEIPQEAFLAMLKSDSV
ncbi:MAG: translation elongation factor 4 [Nitrospinota bacterium]|nr:translation elongation factor 4 [Nitrospinota bacterium]MDH5679226.1 translation elongation factor 4 [Nitrospinota bacterium]MDH5757763.1 translation elongation factor 4 [Nitrospinota bacterium]